MNTYCSHWFNKRAVWPIAKPNKVRRDKKTEDARMEKGRVRESPADAERARWACYTYIRYQVMWQGIDKKYGLI